MIEIEKLVAFVEQTICCGDACLCPGGDCFQSMERGKAVAVIRRTLEFAAGRAKVAWLTTDCGTIGGAEYGEALCNEISEDLRSLSKTKED